MNLSKLAPLFLMILFACVSGTKRLAELDAATGNPAQLQKQCQKGISGACALLGKPVVFGAPLSILQGLTSPTETRFTVLAPKKERRRYFARSSQGIAPLRFERVEWRTSPIAVDQVEAFDLKLGTDYELIVIDGDGMALDKRRFHALDTAKKNPRLGVVSCQDDSLKTEQAAMWAQFLTEKVDALFMIGDNVYADRIPGGWQQANSAQLWDRYLDTRQTIDFYKASELIPVLASWDDHDFGRNDSDRTYPLKEDSLKVFESFFPQSRPTGHFVRGPGVASAWEAFGMKFILTDDRSFRSPNGVATPDQTHFGPAQEDWIMDQIATAPGPVWFMSGDQFFGGYNPFESYEGNHPQSFKAQLARWKSSKFPIVFVSGDRHLAEIIEVPRKTLGYSTFELTSSPMHASVFPNALKEAPSPHQLVGVAGKYNYMVVDVQKIAPRQIQMNVRSRGMEQATLFQRKLTVKK